MASKALCKTACSGSTQFSFEPASGECMCYPFTGSNDQNDGCYVTDNASIWCSYETAAYPCGYTTGTSTPPSPDGTCGTGAFWGHPVNNNLSTTTESSVRDCFIKCLFYPSCG